MRPLKSRRIVLYGVSIVAISMAVLTVFRNNPTNDSEDNKALSQEAIDESIERDAFIIDRSASRALATVNYIATANVVKVATSPELPGAYVIETEIASIEWATSTFWSMGSEHTFTAPPVNTVVKLVIDDTWQPTTGDTWIMAITTETRPLPDIEGYVRYAVTREGDVAPLLRTPPNDSVPAFVSTALSLKNPKNQQAQPADRLASLVNLVEDAHEWMSRRNLQGPDQLPRGLLKQIEEELAIGLGDGEQRAIDRWLERDAKYRQLPASFDEIDGLASHRKDLNIAEVMVDVDVLDAKPSYVALRFRGLGVLGPFNVDQTISFATLSGVIPSQGTVELLVWDTDDALPGDELVSARIKIPNQFDSETHVLFIEMLSKDDATVSVVSAGSAANKITARLKLVDPGPRSEVDGANEDS